MKEPGEINYTSKPFLLYKQASFLDAHKAWRVIFSQDRSLPDAVSLHAFVFNVDVCALAFSSRYAGLVIGYRVKCYSFLNDYTSQFLLFSRFKRHII